MTKYFIMMAMSDHDDANIVAMTDDDEGEHTALFNSEHEAELAAMDNRMALAYGYEVYPWN